MKNYLMIFTILGLLFSGMASQAQSADEIVNDYFLATGHDKTVKIKTMTTTGKILQGGMELPFVMYNARPSKLRMEISIQGQKIIQAFDGTNGWMINPMTGSLDPQDMNPDQVKQLQQQADMDGLLYNYKEKGSTLEYSGKDEVEGTEVYKLKLTDKNNDITYYYIDTDSNILLKTTAKRTIQGTEIEGNTLYGNYQMVEGMAIPFSITTMVNGQVAAEIVVEKTSFDKEVPDSIFVK